MGNENDFVNYPRMVSGFWVYNSTAASIASSGLDPKVTPPTQDYSLLSKTNFVNSSVNNHISSNLNSIINELSPNNINNNNSPYNGTTSYKGGFKLQNNSSLNIFG